MTAGTYAIDVEPFGPPYVAVDGRPEHRAVHVPGGPRGTFVLAPGDVRGTTAARDPRQRQGHCGPDGMNGPNLACTGCGREVATEVTDCWTWQETRLYPDAVRVVPVPEGL
jgi:hypothetical protein